MDQLEDDLIALWSMDYTNKQIDLPKIYCLICMCRCRATKTLAMTCMQNAKPPKLPLWLCTHKRKATKASNVTFAQCKATKTPTVTWNNKLVCKCKDKLPKQLKTQSNVKRWRKCSIDFTKFTTVLNPQRERFAWVLLSSKRGRGRKKQIAWYFTWKTALLISLWKYKNS